MKDTLIDKFKEVWEDVIENNNSDIESFEQNAIPFCDLQDYYDNLNSAWNDNWNDFLDNNNIYGNLEEDEQDEISNINIFEYLF